MTETQQKIMESLLAEHKRGALTEARLRQGISDIVQQSGQKQQDILYLQCSNTSPGARVIGMMLIEDGELREGSSDPDEWPYQTPLDAIRDGWRIISFPNMALLTVEEEEFYGLGFEFILERWR